MILDPIDQRVRDQGFNFVPFDRYLAERFQPNTLDMSGGISTLPVGSQSTLPFILNPDAGRGGGGITTAAPDTAGFDYETDAYGLDDMSAADKGLTDDEQEALDNLNNPGLTTGMKGTIAGTIFGLVNPFSAIGSLKYQQNKQKEALEEKAREAAAKADFDRAMADQKSFYDSLNEGRGASVSDKSRDEAGDGNQAGPSPFAYGGRVPYMMGGLTDLVDIYD